MNVLNNLKPQRVFAIFEEISGIPRGSGNTDRIARWCVDFADRNGLRCVRDDANNVVIYKDATVGYEQSPTVILQGHLDMVCAKTPDCDIDMENEGVRVAVDGDWVHALGTSLGGDNGIAVAMALSILTDDALPHPALEVVLTTDEETGLNGAFALDASLLKGRRMLNLDSEEEGIFTVSCAGGVRAESCFHVTRHTCKGVACTITIDGLLGGHSGVEIHKGRANAIQLLGRVLYTLQQEVEFSLLSLNGGVVDNAIPLTAAASILVPRDAVARAREIVTKVEDVFKLEYATTDSGVSVTAQFVDDQEADALDKSSADRIVAFLIGAPTGVQVMSPDIPDLVQTSLNLGVLSCEGTTVTAVFSLRSSLETQKAMLRDRLTALTKAFGGTIAFSADYPGWAYRKESPLRETALEAYRALFGQEPQVVAIHAGLECGLFSDKIPHLDCISFGPNMQDIHTVNERLSIASVERTYELVLEILKRCR